MTAWLAERLAGLAPPLRFTKLAGGHSNFTYRVDDEAGRTFVLRRPPLGELLPMAHDMGREFTIISALWPTAVPVPEPLAYCDDPSVTGARFYAMGWVEGRPLYTMTDAEEHLDEPARARTGPSFIDTLADLHAVDPDEVGLGGLGKRDSYVGRQLHRWYSSWNSSKNRELPDVDRLHDFLVGRLPDQTGGERRARRLRPAQLPGRRPTDPSPPSSTGRSRPWATRSPTWPTASMRGWNRPTRWPAGTTPRPSCPGSPAARSCSIATPPRTGADLPHRVLPLLQPLEDRLHRAGRLCPLPPRSEGHRGCRGGGVPWADRTNPATGGRSGRASAGLRVPGLRRQWWALQYCNYVGVVIASRGGYVAMCQRTFCRIT